MITWVTVWILTVAPYKSGAFQLEFQTKQQCITQYNFQLQFWYGGGEQEFILWPNQNKFNESNWRESLEERPK